MHGSVPNGRSRGPELTPAAWLRRVPPVPAGWFVREERATGIHGAAGAERGRDLGLADAALAGGRAAAALRLL